MTLTPGRAVARGPAGAVVALVVISALAAVSADLLAQSRGGWSGPAASGSPQRPDTWDTFMADVTVRSGRVDRAGRRLGVEGEPIRYRLERRHGGGQWKTRLTMTDVPQALLTVEGTVQADRSHAIAAIEGLEDATEPRFYDRSGLAVQAPSSADFSRLTAPRIQGPLTDMLGAVGQPAQWRPRGGGADWLEAFVPTRSKRAERLAAFVRTHGPARGRVGGLDRFVSTENGRTRETLVDPELALPRESNQTEGARLIVHRAFDYGADTNGLLVRRAMRTERLLSAESGERMAVEVELSNVRFETRR